MDRDVHGREAVAAVAGNRGVAAVGDLRRVDGDRAVEVERDVGRGVVPVGVLSEHGDAVARGRGNHHIRVDHERRGDRVGRGVADADDGRVRDEARAVRGDRARARDLHVAGLDLQRARARGGDVVSVQVDHEVLRDYDRGRQLGVLEETDRVAGLGGDDGGGEVPEVGLGAVGDRDDGGLGAGLAELRDVDRFALDGADARIPSGERVGAGGVRRSLGRLAVVGRRRAVRDVLVGFEDVAVPVLPRDGVGVERLGEHGRVGRIGGGRDDLWSPHVFEGVGVLRVGCLGRGGARVRRRYARLDLVDGEFGFAVHPRDVPTGNDLHPTVRVGFVADVAGRGEPRRLRDFGGILGRIEALEGAPRDRNRRGPAREARIVAVDQKRVGRGAVLLLDVERAARDGERAFEIVHGGKIADVGSALDRQLGAVPNVERVAVVRLRVELAGGRIGGVLDREIRFRTLRAHERPGLDPARVVPDVDRVRDDVPVEIDRHLLVHDRLRGRGEIGDDFDRVAGTGAVDRGLERLELRLANLRDVFLRGEGVRARSRRLDPLVVLGDRAVLGEALRRQDGHAGQIIVHVRDADRLHARERAAVERGGRRELRGVLRNRDRRALGGAAAAVGLVAVGVRGGRDRAAVHRERTRADLDARVAAHGSAVAHRHVRVAVERDADIRVLARGGGRGDRPVHDDGDLVLGVLQVAEHEQRAVHRAVHRHVDQVLLLVVAAEHVQAVGEAGERDVLADDERALARQIARAADLDRSEVGGRRRNRALARDREAAARQRDVARARDVLAIQVERDGLVLARRRVAVVATRVRGRRARVDEQAVRQLNVLEQLDRVAVCGRRERSLERRVADRADFGNRFADRPDITVLDRGRALNDGFGIGLDCKLAAADEAGLAPPGSDPLPEFPSGDCDVVGHSATETDISVERAAGDAHGTVSGSRAVERIHARNGSAGNVDVGIRAAHDLDAHVGTIVVAVVVADGSVGHGHRTALVVEHADRGRLLRVDRAAVDCDRSGTVVVDRVGRATRARIVESAAIHDQRSLVPDQVARIAAGVVV